MQILQYKTAVSKDFDQIAAFIASINTKISNHCLHCDTETQIIKNEIKDAHLRNEICLIMALKETELVGVFGGDGEPLPNGKRFWLWGPFVKEDIEEWEKVADGMLLFLLQQMPNNKELWFFVNAKANKLRAYYQKKGFEERENQSHVYVASKTNYLASQNPNFKIPSYFSILSFEPSYCNALEKLHTSAFPDGGYSVEEMIKMQDNKHSLWIIIAPNEDFAGYLFAAVQAENEGYIHFLAIEKRYRKKGVGEALMRKALHWTFEEQQLSQAALTVGDKNNARRLYAKVGFELLYSGVGGVKKQS